MMLGLKLAGLIALLAASDVSAQGLMPTIIGNTIAMQSRPGMPAHWVYDTDADYAVWDASSTSVAGSEVSYVGKRVAIDQAPLVPQSLYESDQDLFADGKIWLPRGGLLVKMVGGERGGNWFCTWRFDKTASATSEKARSGERELCLQTDGAGHTIDNRLELSLFPALLTILPSVREVRIKNLNSINLYKTDRKALPPRIALEVFAEWHNRDGGTVCLHGWIETIEADKEQCFGGIDQSTEYAGGRYTLTTLGQDHSFTIRIDRAFDARGLAPERR